MQLYGLPPIETLIQGAINELVPAGSCIEVTVQGVANNTTHEGYTVYAHWIITGKLKGYPVSAITEWIKLTSLIMEAGPGEVVGYLRAKVRGIIDNLQTKYSNCVNLLRWPTTVRELTTTIDADSREFQAAMERARAQVQQVRASTTLQQQYNNSVQPMVLLNVQAFATQLLGVNLYPVQARIAQEVIDSGRVPRNPLDLRAMMYGEWLTRELTETHRAYMEGQIPAYVPPDTPNASGVSTYTHTNPSSMPEWANLRRQDFVDAMLMALLSINNMQHLPKKREPWHKVTDKDEISLDTLRNECHDGAAEADGINRKRFSAEGGFSDS